MAHHYRRGKPVSPPPIYTPGVTDWRTQGPAAEVLKMPAPVPKARPLLEVNQRPAKDLAELIDKLGSTRVERELNVHRTTVKRWVAGQVKIPGHQHQVIRMLLGHLPGTEGKWPGWSFSQGELVAPSGAAYRAGDVLAIGLERQRIRALENELHQLKIRLAIAEEAERRHAGAANEDLRVRA